MCIRDRSFIHTLQRARSSNNPCANYDDVVGGRGHALIPMQNGSFSSRIKSASAVMNADPLILGWTTLSETRTEPSKIEPTRLSCLQIWPSLIFPSANKHASLALVPVPHLSLIHI